MYTHQLTHRRNHLRQLHCIHAVADRLHDEPYVLTDHEVAYRLSLALSHPQPLIFADRLALKRSATHIHSNEVSHVRPVLYPNTGSHHWSAQLCTHDSGDAGALSGTHGAGAQ